MLSYTLYKESRILNQMSIWVWSGLRSHDSCNAWTAKLNWLRGFASFLISKPRRPPPFPPLTFFVSLSFIVLTHLTINTWRYTRSHNLIWCWTSRRTFYLLTRPFSRQHPPAYLLSISLFLSINVSMTSPDSLVLFLLPQVCQHLLLLYFWSLMHHGSIWINSLTESVQKPFVQGDKALQETQNSHFLHLKA